jgi:hypothetical protein
MMPDVWTPTVISPADINVIAFILAAALGHFFGREIRGTTISGLKIALVIYPPGLRPVGLGGF